MPSEKPVELINHFVLEHKKSLSDYDINSFKYATSQLMQESIFQAPLPDASRYCNYIDRMLEYLNQVSVSADTLDKFYSTIYKSPVINDKNIAIPLRPLEDIDKIRPEYLTNIPMEFNTAIQGILDGSMKSDDIKINYISGKYFDKVKKQIVKTTIPFNDVRDLMVLSSPAIVKIDNVYIQNNIIPFLRSYNRNISELTTIAKNTRGRILNTYTEMVATMNAVARIENDPTLDINTKRKLGYLKYNMYRQYLNVCAYVVALLTRKMLYYTYNIMVYINLYNTLYNYFPDGERVLHEYVEGDDISDIDDSTILYSMLNNGLAIAIPHIQKATNMKKLELSNLIAKRHQIKINYMDMPDTSKYPYDTRPYASINQTIKDIVNNLCIFEENSKDKNMIVDDILTKSNLDTAFVTQYESTLNNLTSMEYYTVQKSALPEDDESIVMSLYSDLGMFPKNMSIISNNVGKCYRYIEHLTKQFEINSYGLDDISFSEYQSVLERVMKNFKEYALAVAKKLLERLDALVDLMSSDSPGESPSDPTPVIPENYSISSYIESYNEICEVEKSIFESMMKDYYAFRKKKESGVTILFEEVSEASPEDGKQASVQTDAVTQHSQNENKSSSAGESDNKEKESIVERFNKWIQGIIDKFLNKSSRMSDKNNKWLESVKQDILNLDTSNTTINIAKYEDVTSEKINADIQSAINKINGVNASNIPADLKNKSQAEKFIFASIPAKIGKETEFGPRIKQYLTFGNTDKTNLMTYSGEDAKTKISSMIEFCEKYHVMYKSITDNLDKLSKAASDKQQAIINALGTQGSSTTTTSTGETKTESVLFEAQTQSVSQNGSNKGGNKDDKEKLSSSSIITSTVREYVGAVLTVVEKKYLDYIKVLSKLAPEKNNTPTTEENDSNEDNK